MMTQEMFCKRCPAEKRGKWEFTYLVLMVKPSLLANQNKSSTQINVARRSAKENSKHPNHKKKSELHKALKY